ncbi:MAG TPA: cytochrome c-type biogenesis CcmF C-terminal domain-containing protein [Nocardioidaceae bacterium]|nr:cytochrome c-type biogenesis CcmF C-terminal domain-containing protein [Nocardioidaceae bacterium]
MTAWLGTFALALGFSASLGSIGLWARAAAQGGADGSHSPPARAARYGAWLIALGAVGAVAAVEWALVTHDFSLRFVAENGSTSTPLYYTITSLWAAHDGSLLLWLLVLSGYIAVLAFRPPRAAGALHPWAMAVLCLVAAFFFGLVLFTTQAFETVVPAPAGGPGPNPLLQDHPAMGIHPPLLYIGFIGMAVPFAFAVAGLITGDVSRRWLDAVRTYTLFAWTALTAGVVLGAWWSYAVLGWGGYWAWDPVENASLLPWLVATALLHSGLVQRHREALPAWTLSLAVAAFLLACLGTFLTRSGVVVSVHAFADSPVGPILLGFVVALAIGVAALVVLRADRLGPPRPTGSMLSRGSALLLNNVLLVCLALTVLLGTLFPLAAELLADRQLSVGPPYYNRMAVPIALVLLLLMAVGPVVRWQGDEPARLIRRLAVPVAVGACVVTLLALSGTRGTAPLLAFGLASVVATTIGAECVSTVRRTRAARSCGWARAVGIWAVRRRHRNSGLLVHLGVAVAVVGIAASSAYTVSTEQRLTVGEQVSISGVSAELSGVERTRTERVMSTAAQLVLRRPDGEVSEVDPALRFFPAHGMTVASPVVLSDITGDVYVTLLAVDQDGSQATVRLAVNPLVGWIWAGGAMMALGAALALWPRRRSRGSSQGTSRGTSRGDRVGSVDPEPASDVELDEAVRQ